MGSSTTNRTVALWESAYDLGQLSANNQSYCIAKSVTSSTGTTSFNLVWQSKALSPRATITWTVQYGLNWTLNIPTGNAQVTIGGVWQACNPGQVFDLDKNGLFQPSTVVPEPNFLKIGKNGYKYPGTSGIHILVGVKTPGGQFEPIYVDTTALGLNMSSWYQPQEKAQWWFQGGVQSATMITGSVTDVCTYDLTTPNAKTGTYNVSTTYLWDTGLWTTSLDPPPDTGSTGLLGAMTKAPPHIANTGGSELDNVRADVERIIAILQKMEAYNKPKVNEITWTGIVVWATAVAAAAGAAVILNKLIDKGYIVEVSISVTKGTFKITPSPRGIQEDEAAAGVVPEQVTADWNSAVEADAKDNPTNEGIN